MPQDNPFQFLEGVLTEQSLRALRNVNAENARRLAQSMNANERAGFFAGRMIFGALSNAFGPGKKNRELAEAGTAALNQSAEMLESIPETEFEGPHGGIKRNLARAEALAQTLASRGLNEDAMRAQIAANNFKTQLEEAEQAFQERQLTSEGRRQNNERLRLANQAERRLGFLNNQTYYLDLEKDQIVQSLDGGNAAFPAYHQQLLQANPNLLPLSRDEYVRYMQNNRSEVARADANLLTRTRFDTRLREITGNVDTLRIANQMFDVWLDAESNPLTTVSAATRFGNRLLNEVDEARNVYNSNVARAEQQGARGEFSGEPLTTEQARTNDVRLWMQQRGIERQMSASLLQRLTWSFTRAFNGSRPTDRDYERIYNMLGGDSGSPEVASTALSELFNVDVDRVNETYAIILNTEGEAGRTYGQTQQGRVLQRTIDNMNEHWGTFRSKFDQIQEWSGRFAPEQPVGGLPEGTFFNGRYTLPDNEEQ